jgi:hypothetical protein
LDEKWHSPAWPACCCWQPTQRGESCRRRPKLKLRLRRRPQKKAKDEEAAKQALAKAQDRVAARYKNSRKRK